MRQWAPTFSREKHFLPQRQDARQSKDCETFPYQEGLENGRRVYWVRDEFREYI